MARISYLLRRGASYYARIKVPTDLVEIVGKKELVKALGTKDENIAKREMWPVVEGWNRHFEDLRARRTITNDDKAHATWQHYEASLERDEAARRNAPTQADIDEATRAMFARVERGEISSTDPLAVLDATLEVQVKQRAREISAISRRAKLADMQKHLASGTTALIAHEVDDYVEQNRLLVDRDHPDWKDTARLMMRAEIESLKRSLERDAGDYSGRPSDPVVKPVGSAREVAAPGESIMELFEIYARENPRQITADTLTQARRDVGTFVQLLGSTCPVHRIDKKAVREWKALLMKYPVKATETKTFEGMTIVQIVKHNETVGKPALTPRTVNRYLSSLGAFCNWLVNNGYLEANPTEGMSLAKDKKKKVFPFKIEHMNTLFSAPLFVGCESDEAPRFWKKPGDILIRDHRYWVPLIMLYSGARPAEIAQLLVSDVRQEHGHWIMDITETDDEDEDTGKSVKNVGSRRVVPVHSELVRLGFLKYHASMKNAGQARLFPKAERNERGQMIADFSREFNRYLTRLGIKNGRGLSLYSFRHGAFDAMRRAGYREEQFAYLFGHVNGSQVSRGYGVLSSGTLEQRIELVNAIQYPGLSLNHLI